MKNEKGEFGSALALLAFLVIVLWLVGNAQNWFGDINRHTYVRAIEQHAIYMDDGSVWDTSDTVGLLKGDKITFQNIDGEAGTFCELNDSTTGATIVATRISAPFTRESCPSGISQPVVTTDPDSAATGNPDSVAVVAPRFHDAQELQAEGYKFDTATKAWISPMSKHNGTPDGATF